MSTASRNHFWYRLSATGGILYVVLALAGNSIGHLEPPSAPASRDAMTAYWTAQSTAWPLGAIIGSLAFFCFVFFLGSLYHVLRQAEGPSGAFSIVAFGGGLLTAIVQLIEVTRTIAAIQIVQEGGDPMIAMALQHMNGGSFVLAWFTLAILLSGTAIVVLRTAVLPRWIGWTAALLALALVGSYSGAIMGLQLPFAFLLTLLWIIGVSIGLMRADTLVSTQRPTAATPSSVVSR